MRSEPAVAAQYSFRTHRRFLPLVYCFSYPVSLLCPFPLSTSAFPVRPAQLRTHRSVRCVGSACTVTLQHFGCALCIFSARALPPWIFSPSSSLFLFNFSQAVVAAAMFRCFRPSKCCEGAISSLCCMSLVHFPSSYKHLPCIFFLSFLLLPFLHDQPHPQRSAMIVGIKVSSQWHTDSQQSWQQQHSEARDWRNKGDGKNRNRTPP